MSRIDRETLEALVDENSLYDVIEALSQICIEKAIDLRNNSGDESTVREWQDNQKNLETLTPKINN